MVHLFTQNDTVLSFALTWDSFQHKSLKEKKQVAGKEYINRILYKHIFKKTIHLFLY